MKKSKRVSNQRPAARRARAFRAGVFACALLLAGVATAVATYALRVNPQTLQQAPQSQPLADQLEGNKTTDGLVQEKHDDGTVSVDLQGRFQNVTMAKKNDDGSVSSACVDTPEAARAFLNSQEKTVTITGTGVNRKAASRQ
ncbi:MAG: hypothetical protein QOH49_1640 [Acidobacteriota bacterium]|jgi:hypothetical protein|nr:hypothetical protein [Acidobacteriota bacterium]